MALAGIDEVSMPPEPRRRRRVQVRTQPRRLGPDKAPLCSQLNQKSASTRTGRCCSEDAVLYSIHSHQDIFLSCSQWSSRNSLLLPSLSMRKVLEAIFQEPDPYFRHNHNITGVSWGLVLKVHVRGRAVLANSTRNTKGEIKP